MAHKDKKDAKKPESSQLVAHKDKKDAKKPELSSQLVAHKDKKDAKKPGGLKRRQKPEA
ncbi:hypothetical protein MPG34_01520 [Helicobacter pylori]|uniref:hypothetical protein n=1 Tax=Helicobacter pylori TaxID=210 RepID=UPI001FD6C34E|nr:hypothetical protein [Helicobacter pylori]UOS00986.1 hypothetical protein MPG34_01520 [Helicobacter pylori]